MTMRSLLGRRDPDVPVESELPSDIEAIARRFAADQRREIRRLMRLSSRMIDLATIFPGAIYAIADPSLADAVDDLTRTDRDLARRWAGRPITGRRVRSVPWRGAPLATLDDLRTLLD